MTSLVELGLEESDYPDPLVDVKQASDYGLEEFGSADRYGHYEILTREDGSPWELGRGSMGVTYKAFDTGLRCVVALKLINYQALGGCRAQKRFRLEARSAAKLRHPNIASVLHLAARQDTWFYSMEFIEGNTLWEIVEESGPIAWKTALSIVQQVAGALAVAHRQSLIHRDVKPNNIMLTSSLPADGAGGAVAKLIDFGLVQSAADGLDDENAIQAYFVGTLGFSSPEQVAAEDLDARSDIYSLGATFFYLLTGDDAQVPAEKRRLSLSDKKVPKVVVELVESMLAMDRAHRPQSSEAVVARCLECEQFGCSSQPALNVRRWLRACGIALCLGLLTILIWKPAFLQSLFTEIPQTHLTMPPHVTLEAYMAQVRARERFLKITEEDNRQALSLFARAIEINPDYDLAYAGLAEAYSQGVRRGWLPGNKMLDALHYAKKAIEISPDSAEAHYALAMVYSHEELQWKAMKQVYRSLRIDPGFEPAMRSFGLAWVTFGFPEKGLPWLKAAAERDPSSAKGWIAIADAYKDLCADAEAEKSFQRARDLEPTGMGTFYGLIHLEILRGQYDCAQALCDRAMVLRPNDRYALTLSAQIAFFRGDVARAESLYRSLLSQDRLGSITFYGSIRYLTALSHLAKVSGRTEEAEKLAHEAEALDRAALIDGPQAWFDLSSLQAIRGDVAAAIESFSKAVSHGWLDYRAVRVDPRFASIRNRPEFIAIAESLRASLAEKRASVSKLITRPLTLDDYPLTLVDAPGVNTP